jgi:hypothetical protein
MKDLTLDEFWKLQDLVDSVFCFYKFNKCSTSEHVQLIDLQRRQVIKMMEYAWEHCSDKSIKDIDKSTKGTSDLA